MNLNDKIASSFMVFEEEHATLSPILNEIRNDSISKFEELGFPSRKLEAWKYTSLDHFLKNDFSLFSEKAVLELREVKKYFLENEETYKLVFINGIFSPFLSETTHNLIDACILSSAISKEKYHPIINQYFNKIAAEKEAMTLLNTSFTKEGAFIRIPKGVRCEKPIEIIYFSTENKKEVLHQHRNLIVVEENAEVQLLERHQSLTSEAVLTNNVTEIFAKENSVIDVYKIQNDSGKANLIDNTYVSQEKSSNVTVHTFSFGGKMTRNNLNFYQKGEGIDSIMKGITLLDEKQHVDHYTLVHHTKPNCESHQDYKGIFAGQSTGVFNGKIIVDQIAQKTNAFQKNDNILTSEKATINTKPQLEIFADDVKCSHGCTIGQLDQEALFYLQSRGIPKKDAIGLLTYAFANDVLKSVRIPALKKQVNELIAKKLGVNLGYDL